MLINIYFKFIRRLLFRRICPMLFFCICFYNIHKYSKTSPSHEQSNEFSYISIESSNSCNNTPSTDEFILKYQPYTLLGTKSDQTRIEPTIERIRTLLEIIRSKEIKYQSLLNEFNVFDMLNPMTSFKSYTDESNIDEIKTLYNRYIKLLSDNKTITINQEFINYLQKISSYLSDNLRNKRTDRFQVECLRKPTFVLACDQGFFDIVQGAIHSLDIYWSDHKIIFYDMGISKDQEELLIKKCKQCTIIKFPFSSIEKYAPHIRYLKNYAFKPFVIQDALRRYGTIIYGDSSARFNKNSFNPVLIDNYIRGFATRELPGHFLSCFTRSDTFKWFNQSYTQYDNIYMSEANFLTVTDTFLSRLIIKAWLICALEQDCLIAGTSATLCSGQSSGLHRFDQSAMVIILTHFFFQGNQSSWSNNNINEPAPYDMFTSIQMSLGDIKRGEGEVTYLMGKKD